MSSIRCPKCNLTNWIQASVCKRCGFELYAGGPAAQSAQIEFHPPAVEEFAEPGLVEIGRQPEPWHGYQTAPHSVSLKTGLALVSMILGIICIPTTFILIGILVAPIALVLGIVALVLASRRPFIYGGKGFAIAGIATSGVALFLMIPLIAAIAIPNLLAAKRAADEGSAISSLRTLFAAEATYIATSGNGYCGDLSSLAKDGLIDSASATGSKKGYQFEIIISDAGRGCEIFATPSSKLGVGRSFMISNDGVLRGANKKGLKADKYDVVVQDSHWGESEPRPKIARQNPL